MNRPDADRVRLTIVTALVLLAAGAVFGMLGGFLQAYVLTVGDIDLPLGGLLVLATLVAALRAAIHLFGTRWAGALILGGWLISSVALALPGPGGDIAIAAGTASLVYLFGGVVVGTACVNVPARLRPPAADQAMP